MRCMLFCLLEAMRRVLEVMRRALEVMRRVLEVMRRVLEDEVMRRVLVCMLEAVEGELCLLEVLEVNAMRCALLCRLEAREGGLCLPAVIRLVLLCKFRCRVYVSLFGIDREDQWAKDNMKHRVGGRNREQFEDGGDLRAQADVDAWPKVLVMMTILGRKSWLL